MQRTIDPKLMEGWVDKLQSNMKNFLESENTFSPQQQLSFIRRQYVLLDTTVKVLNGKAYFSGCLHSPTNRK